ncbi:MAG: D-cysteine desulfhydrase family protein [Pyrinomonadaceae bacterium]
MKSAILSGHSAMSKESLKSLIGGFPRYLCSYLPTPLERMQNLSNRLGGVNLFVKRDDQTGLAFGGNKARKLDFIMADVLAQKCDSVITWAGVQSNWCRQTAAAARKVGIKPILILFKRPNLPADTDGNLFIDLLFDSEVKIVEVESGKNIMELGEIGEFIEEVAEAERRKGNNPYIAPIGGSMTEGSMTKPLGAISFVNAFLEILEQTQTQNVKPDYIILATGSGSTQAGLMVGARLVSPNTKVVGITVSEDKRAMEHCVETIAEQTFKEFGAANSGKEGVIVFDDYVKDGYGILNEETARALRLVAETEGILLDPVYTGRAMVGLIDLIEKGYFKKDDNVVFWHTGGTPALFPYREKILDYLEDVPARRQSRCHHRRRFG